MIFRNALTIIFNYITLNEWKFDEVFLRVKMAFKLFWLNVKLGGMNVQGVPYNELGRPEQEEFKRTFMNNFYFSWIFSGKIIRVLSFVIEVLGFVSTLVWLCYVQFWFSLRLCNKNCLFVNSISCPFVFSSLQAFTASQAQIAWQY